MHHIDLNEKTKIYLKRIKKSKRRISDLLLNLQSSKSRRLQEYQTPNKNQELDLSFLKNFPKSPHKRITLKNRNSSIKAPFLSENSNQNPNSKNLKRALSETRISKSVQTETTDLTSNKTPNIWYDYSNAPQIFMPTPKNPHKISPKLQFQGRNSSETIKNYYKNQGKVHFPPRIRTKSSSRIPSIHKRSFFHIQS